MNKLFIIGNITKDPDARVTQGGVNITSFTVAVNRRHLKDGQQEADFFRVTTWNKLAESCQKYLTKGRKVAVTGTVSVSTYKTQDGQFRAVLEVNADDVEFVGQKQEAKQNGYVDVSTEDLPWG
jgi:single-strand DNA-binding protein